ncbi:MAG TPA: pyridoxine 5'-phosphate synthase [Bdellovibrionales bacterium]|nr:pyridoxine 5'-phosphate synthase [Bdellovibrionales bacterium]
MTILSVNVNKLATLRNSRGGNNPDVVKGSLDLIRFGAQGITVHPRPDERHIRKTDVYSLKKAISVELNIEGYPSDDFLAMVEDVHAAQCTLVPDPPHVLTSNAGWIVKDNRKQLESVGRRLKNAGIRSSVFVDPETIDEEGYIILRDAGIDRVELYTEAFAVAYATGQRDAVTTKYLKSAEAAHKVGLGVNAGHDLSLENLEYLIKRIPFIDEVSIGHALICDALYLGFEETVRRYLECIRKGNEAARVSDQR